MNNIGIVGSRKRNSIQDCDLVINALETVYITGDRMVSGGCKEGADSFAEQIHQDTRGAVGLLIYPPNLRKRDELVSRGVSKRNAYAAVCLERNTLIANKAHILIACVAPDRKGGTEDTIKKFLKKNKLSEEEAISCGKLILV